jgi:hypothetical protein
MRATLRQIAHCHVEVEMNLKWTILQRRKLEAPKGWLADLGQSEPEDHFPHADLNTVTWPWRCQVKQDLSRLLPSTVVGGWSFHSVNPSELSCCPGWEKWGWVFQAKAKQMTQWVKQFYSRKLGFLPRFLMHQQSVKSHTRVFEQL